VAAPNPRAQYESRLEEWSAVIAQKERTHLFVSNLRLVAVAAAAVIAWLALARDAFSVGWTLVPAAFFAVLLIAHAFILNALDRAKRATRYYRRGLGRLDGTWMGTGADGARFLDHHAYARDLDLFGHGSLFQLIANANTEVGEETLAAWIGTPASASDVIARQGAVAELRDNWRFREDLAVLAAEARVSRTGTLARWAKAEPVGFTALHALVFATCAVVTTVLIAMAIGPLLTARPVWVWLAVQTAIAAIWRRKVKRAIQGADAASYDLGLLSETLGRIEVEEFRSLQLKALRRALLVNDVPPSRQIATLQFLLAVRDVPRNEFVRPFALLLMLRSQAAVAIDRWHRGHREQLTLWLEAIGELEALSSLATYAFEHPDDPFPVVADGPPLFAAEGLAHPLIPEAVAVRNDVRIGRDHPHVLMVSGSNMSGKSTLLRAVGATTALALAGGPVRATRAALSPLVIGATIRVQDSLQDGQSRFYAEILRIRDIVEASAAKPVLFLLDEILHGTNSHDRRIGAEAIVRALVAAGAIGLVTTHDLALTAVSDHFDGRAHNVHFADRIENGAMVFDYRMRDGVVEHSNALELMRAVGLKV
jgi:hypothetical protein